MKVIWNLTRLCSWNCLICCVSATHVNNKQKEDVYNKMLHMGEELSLQQKKDILDDLYENKVESIDFSGGDLLLRNDDIKLVKYAATKFSKDKLSISIPGNGLNLKLINELKNCISKIEFTLDTINEETDGSRPKGYVSMAKSAIKLCNKGNIDISVSTVLKNSNSNSKSLNRIYNFLIEQGVKEWEILRYYQVGRATEIYAIAPTKERFNNSIEYIQKLIQEGIINISFQHSIENKLNGNIKCNTLDRSIGILPNGTVTACAWGLGYNNSPINDNFNLGIMPKQKLSKILKSEKALTWQKRKFRDGKHICQVEEVISEKYNICNNLCKIN
jgi:MoaA/NifB/PqqE/SkfB family radical SAM enzyme